MEKPPCGAWHKPRLIIMICITIVQQEFHCSAPKTFFVVSNSKKVSYRNAQEGTYRNNNKSYCSIKTWKKLQAVNQSASKKCERREWRKKSVLVTAPPSKNALTRMHAVMYGCLQVLCYPPIIVSSRREKKNVSEKEFLTSRFLYPNCQFAVRGLWVKNFGLAFSASILECTYTLCFKSVCTLLFSYAPVQNKILCPWKRACSLLFKWAKINVLTYLRREIPTYFSLWWSK